jgi:hypothetical protein
MTTPTHDELEGAGLLFVTEALGVKTVSYEDLLKMLSN